jgi:ribosomal-protein-alanine N-acetyltransferase
MPKFSRSTKNERLRRIGDEYAIRHKPSAMSQKPAMSQLIIRPATRADISAMLLLTENTPTAARWTREQHERTQQTDSPRRVTLVCEQQSEIQGFITALVIGEEWEIENVVVAADAHRRGHASRLLQRLLESARTENAGAVYLEVRESNIAACALYEKFGFQETGRRRRYYSDPVEDAVLYRYTLA